MLRIAQSLTAFVSVAMMTAAIGAQDPGRDLPHVREHSVPAGKRVAEITRRLQFGWNWEAARLCREMLVADGDAPLPHALLALAMREQPNRAARHCWDAVQRRGNGSPSEQKIVDALQRYLGVTSQPELVDARFQKQPADDRRVRYTHELAGLAMGEQGGALAADLVSIEAAAAARSKRRGDVQEPAAAEAVLRRHNAYLQAMRAMPFEVPGYAALVARYVGDESERERQLARLPRHPDYASRGPVRALPGQQQVGMDLWQPAAAAKFSLPSGVGGTGTFDPAAGKPTLVVFFLGFGCAHCVAQLKDLDPKADTFRAAGIEVVSIGTDSLEQVKAAQQAARENGVDPLHFDVLCDPKGAVFKQWNVWDQFSDQALHGTFLVDGKGRVLWQDISERPFEQTDWLLAECQRLLAAWQ